MEVCGYAGTNEIANLDFLCSIYPNPFENDVTIQLPSTVNYSSPADIVILDAVGKEVAYFSFTSELNTIDLSFLNRGMYFVQVQHGGQLSTRKMSKR